MFKSVNRVLRLVLASEMQNFRAELQKLERATARSNFTLDGKYIIRPE